MRSEKALHKKILSQICDKFDQHLKSPACRGLRRHLSNCPECAAYLDSIRKTVSLYRRYPTPRLSRSARQKLLSFVRAPK